MTIDEPEKTYTGYSEERVLSLKSYWVSHETSMFKW